MLDDDDPSLGGTYIIEDLDKDNDNDKGDDKNLGRQHSDDIGEIIEELWDENYRRSPPHRADDCSGEEGKLQQIIKSTTTTTSPPPQPRTTQSLSNLLRSRGGGDGA